MIHIVMFFMPPIWAVLAFFRIHDCVPIGLLTPGMPSARATGRRAGALGVRHRLFYAFGPIRSPRIFIAAGLVAVM